MVIELLYKLGELTIIDLVGDLQVFKLHHLLSRQNQNVTGKGKGISFKTTKGSSANKDVSTTIVCDEKPLRAVVPRRM